MKETERTKKIYFDGITKIESKRGTIELVYSENLNRFICLQTSATFRTAEDGCNYMRAMLKVDRDKNKKMFRSHTVRVYTA